MWPSSCNLQLEAQWAGLERSQEFISVLAPAIAGGPLWIDAICINLANDPERTHQVRLMADIYGKAFQVIAWLGTAYEQSDDAMNGLLEFNGDGRALELVP
jgi:hypothetical protein